MNAEVQVRVLPSGLFGFYLVDADASTDLMVISSIYQVPAFEAAMAAAGSTPEDIVEFRETAYACLRAEAVPAPLGWKQDALSQMFGQAEFNTRLSFYYDRRPYKRLLGIFDLFEQMIAGAGEDHHLSVLLFSQGTAMYGAAVNLALSTQVPPTYLVLRGCLENFLYGFYLYKHPCLVETWKNRHKGNEERRVFRRKFLSSDMIAELKKVDAQAGEDANILYERTIDFGAHPNPRGLFTNLLGSHHEEGVRPNVMVLNGNEVANDLCRRTIAQVGVCGLQMMKPVLPVRYAELGVEAIKDHFSRGISVMEQDADALLAQSGS